MPGSKDGNGLGVGVGLAVGLAVAVGVAVGVALAVLDSAGLGVGVSPVDGVAVGLSEGAGETTRDMLVRRLATVGEVGDGDGEQAVTTTAIAIDARTVVGVMRMVAPQVNQASNLLLALYPLLPHLRSSVRTASRSRSPALLRLFDRGISFEAPGRGFARRVRN
ncbi:MAG TPA: hypothetical protein V6D47_12495 [Oscillatoriaceae cyanobacterium]